MSTTDIEEAIQRGHPASNLFPMLSDAELWDLAEDISQQGLKDEIELYEGLILDGRNRWVACMRAGVTPRTVTWDGASPTAHVISKNLKRRHLEPGQRAAVAVDALALFEAEAKERQGARTDLMDDLPANLQEGSRGEAAEHAAEQFDVSPRYVYEAKRVKEEAPEVFERLKAGDLNIPQAKREASSFVLPEREEASPEERAYYALSRQRLVVTLDAAQVAGFCADPGLSVESFATLEAWLHRFNEALRSQAVEPLRVLR